MRLLDSCRSNGTPDMCKIFVNGKHHPQGRDVTWKHVTPYRVVVRNPPIVAALSAHDMNDVNTEL